MEKSPEIVITGLGVVSSIGSGKDAFWNALMEGTSGVSLLEDTTLENYQANGVAAPMAGFIRDLDKKRIRPRKSIKVMARDIQLGVAASDYAREDAQLEAKPVDPERQGIVFGALMIICALDEIYDVYKGAIMPDGTFENSQFGNKMDAMYPLWMLKYLPNMTACHIGVANDLRGPSDTLVVGDIGGVSAIIEAMRAIERGAADIMYTGGCNSSANVQGVTHYSMYPLTHDVSDPAHAYRPFDENRSGGVLAEGAGSCILETRDSAEKRDVPVHASIIGYAETTEAVWNPATDFAPQKEDVRICTEKLTGKCIANAIRLAVQRADVKPEDVAFVMANGYGSKFHDRIEAEAIASVLGNDVPVTTINAATGYSMAGSSAISVVASVLSLEKGLIPAIPNSTTPASDCPVKLVMGAPLPTDKKIAVVVSYNYYGQAAVIVLRKN